MQIIRIKDVLNMLDISKPTLYKHINKGKIPCFKIEGRLKFYREEIQAYIDSDRQKLIINEGMEAQIRKINKHTMKNINEEFNN